MAELLLSWLILLIEIDVLNSSRLQSRRQLPFNVIDGSLGKIGYIPVWLNGIPVIRPLGEFEFVVCEGSNLAAKGSNYRSLVWTALPA